ncbi:uncharacterized protein [Odocoileus virginianus]|uniref:Uncharacterized protein isoform X10 n=1 Tax=Odocoileus virginianus TaxID=9874 RepID=A0ABM4HJM1_ODOVR
MEHTDGPGPGHVTILSRTRVSCSWCISAGDSSSTSHWSLDQREGSCQTETLPSAWEFLIGLLRFQQSFVSVSHLHLEKKDVESLGRPQCPSPPTTGEPTTGRTDPDFVSDVSEKEQRRGAKAVPGSGHQEHINIHKLRETVFQEHQTLREKELEMGTKASHGYGGKFGVEQDRMDKGWGKTTFLSSSVLKHGPESSLSRGQKCRPHHLRLLVVPLTPAFPLNSPRSAHRNGHLGLG